MSMYTNEYIKSFNGRKEETIYLISRWGWYLLSDGNDKKYTDDEKTPFTIDEKFKMIDAAINGYEIDVPKFKFYVFPKNSYDALYYTGQGSRLTNEIDKALVIEKDSKEYKALESLGFSKMEL